MLANTKAICPTLYAQLKALADQELAAAQAIMDAKPGKYQGNAKYTSHNAVGNNLKEAAALLYSIR